VTIRKPRKEAFTAEQLIQSGACSRGMMEFLQTCVAARKNVVVSGGLGSGKTTTLNVMSGFIPEWERILTIEDGAELQLKHQHWVQLEGRPPNVEGKGGVSIRDLVRASLRHRPDRIIVGECRGGEVLDVLQAMNTGFDGVLTTTYSNGPKDTVSRLETMISLSGLELSLRIAREQIASAVNIIVHLARFSDGIRRMTHISEVAGMEGDGISLQDVFIFRQEGFDEQRRVRGRFMPTGLVPRFCEDLQRRGTHVNMSIFRE
jgi:pilus assembly protein CpaF